MLGKVGRRLVEGIVSLFALLGFLYVPLGQHTGFEHARAVLSTPAASAAIEDLYAAALRLRVHAVELVTGRAAVPAPAAEIARKAGERRNQHKGHEPRPVPPTLK